MTSRHAAKRLTRFLALVIFCQAIVAAAVAQGGDVLEYGYSEFPPFFFTKDDGRPSGDLISLADGAFATASMPWVAKSYSFTRLMENLISGKSDVSMLIKHPHLIDKVHYGTQPISTLELRAYWVGDKPPIKTREDLRAKSIITLRNYGYSGWIDYIKSPDNNIVNHATDSHDTAFKMLQFGRADYVLDYKAPSERALEKVVTKDLHYSVISSFDVYLLVSKKTPNAYEILKALETAVLEGRP